MIESLSSWFTPTVLFCVLNLMIGIILISSSFKNDKKQQQQYAEDNNLPQLPRTPSLLQRVRSVNYFSFVPEPFNSPLNTPHFADNSSPRLGYSPSLLQRVRSINFSFSRSEKPSPFPSLDQYAAGTADENEPQKVETVTVTDEEEDSQCHVMRSKSTTCAETTLMKKLASEEMLAAVQKEEEEEEEEEKVVVVPRRPATVRERKQGNRGTKKSFGRDDEAVDRKADDFISKFREQLKMQRIDSIQRYKEMLNRGVSI